MKFHFSSSPIIKIAHRAKKLDEVASSFFAGHPRAVGLDLGAGLDTRALRIDPPSTVDWFDIDFPEVVAARRALIPEREHVHNLGADLTDPDWLDAVPSDRPAVIVADGLMAFLSQGDMVALLDRLTRSFPQRADRLQRLHQVRDLGSQPLPRNSVRCGSAQVARLR